MATSRAPHIQSAVGAVSFPLEEGMGHQAVNVVDGVTCPGVAIGSDLSSALAKLKLGCWGGEGGTLPPFPTPRFRTLGPEPSTS